MAPESLRQDGFDCLFTDVELYRQHLTCHYVWTIRRPYLLYLVLRQLREAVSFAFRKAPFLLGVVRIVGISTKKQMRRAHAQTIVAMMADNEVRRHLVPEALAQFVGISMRNHSVPICQPYQSIAGLCFVSGPFPTARREPTWNESPKPERQGFRRSSDWLTHVVHYYIRHPGGGEGVKCSLTGLDTSFGNLAALGAVALSQAPCRCASATPSANSQFSAAAVDLGTSFRTAESDRSVTR